MRLVVDVRPGIAILSGRVNKIENNGGITVITLKNNLVSEEEGGSEMGTVLIDYEPDYVKRMKLKVGSFIVATTTVDPVFDILLDGGVTKTKKFHVRGYRFIYSGHLAFDRRGRRGESHVYFCNIISGRDRKSWNGQYISTYEVSYRDGKDQVVKTFHKFGEMFKESSVGNKAIITTGQIKNPEKIWVQDIIA